MIHGEFGPEFDALSIPARDPGQYLYENYLAIFGTTFAPKWKDLTAESRTNWGKLELATRIDCTCNSDPLGRCVVHSALQEPPKIENVAETAIHPTPIQEAFHDSLEPGKIYTTYDGHRYKLAEDRKPIWIDDLPSGPAATGLLNQRARSDGFALNAADAIRKLEQMK